MFFQEKGYVSLLSMELFNLCNDKSIRQNINYPYNIKRNFQEYLNVFTYSHVNEKPNKTSDCMIRFSFLYYWNDLLQLDYILIFHPSKPYEKEDY